MVVRILDSSVVSRRVEAEGAASTEAAEAEDEASTGEAAAIIEAEVATIIGDPIRAAEDHIRNMRTMTATGWVPVRISGEPHGNGGGSRCDWQYAHRLLSSQKNLCRFMVTHAGLCVK